MQNPFGWCITPLRLSGHIFTTKCVPWFAGTIQTGATVSSGASDFRMYPSAANAAPCKAVKVKAAILIRSPDTFPKTPGVCKASGYQSPAIIGNTFQRGKGFLYSATTPNNAVTKVVGFAKKTSFL